MKPAEVSITWTPERDDRRLLRLSELLLLILRDVDSRGTPGEVQEMTDSQATS